MFISSSCSTKALDTQLTIIHCMLHNIFTDTRSIVILAFKKWTPTVPFLLNTGKKNSFICRWTHLRLLEFALAFWSWIWKKSVLLQRPEALSFVSTINKQTNKSYLCVYFKDRQWLYSLKFLLSRKTVWQTIKWKDLLAGILLFGVLIRVSSLVHQISRARHPNEAPSCWNPPWDALADSLHSFNLKICY